MDDTKERIKRITEKLMATICLGGQIKLASWINPTNRRYYKLFAGTDLLGDLILVREWGSLDSNLHGAKTQTLPKKDKLGIERKIEELFRMRERRGYQLKE